MAICQKLILIPSHVAYYYYYYYICIYIYIMRLNYRKERSSNYGPQCIHNAMVKRTL